MELRAYQQDAVALAYEKLADGHRPVLSLPTGSGKTAIASQIVKYARSRGLRVCFMVPFLSLIDQTVRRLSEFDLGRIGVIQGSHELTNPDAMIQVASIQTLIRRQHVPFDLYIHDEAHVMFRQLPGIIGDRPCIGLTATPWNPAMGEIYTEVVKVRSIDELTVLGYLAPVRTLVPGTLPDLLGVPTRRGKFGLDYSVNELSSRVNVPSLVGDVVTTWEEKSSRKNTLVFATDLKHARALQFTFRAHGWHAAYCDADTPRETRSMYGQQLADGELDVVVNCQTLTTGVDWTIDTIVLARPTKSPILYQQIVGRGMRPGKDHLLLLDHTGSTLDLGTVYDLDERPVEMGHFAAPSERQIERKPRRCTHCSFVLDPDATICGYCLSPVVKVSRVRDIKAADGELVEHVDDLREFMGGLLRIAEDRGYKRGWAYHSFRDKFKRDPPDGCVACAPSVRVNGWVRHQQIRNAKKRNTAA